MHLLLVHLCTVATSYLAVNSRDAELLGCCSDLVIITGILYEL